MHKTQKVKEMFYIYHTEGTCKNIQKKLLFTIDYRKEKQGHETQMKITCSLISEINETQEKNNS